MAFLHRFLANRFLYASPNEGTKRPVLLPAVRISALGIALGTALILLSSFIVAGFQSSISQRIYALTGHLKFFNPENGYEQYTIPTYTPDSLLAAMRTGLHEIDEAASLHTFADVMGVIKTSSDFKGVVLHGVDSLFDATAISRHLLAGELPPFKGEKHSGVLLSQRIAERLSLGVDSTFLAYFFDNGSMKVRKLTVSGLYRTGYKEYDDRFVLADIRLVRSVLGWGATESGGATVMLSDERYIEPAYLALFDRLSVQVNLMPQERYSLLTARDSNPVMFGWLDLLDANVMLIMLLMIAVAAMTMITGVIVIILDKVQAISTLKALGQSNSSIRKSFRYVAWGVLWRGLLLGNLAALLLAGVQYLFQPIKLDPTQYYIDHVPIDVSIPTLLIVNGISLLFLYGVMYLPTAIIASIRPAQGIRFE